MRPARHPGWALALALLALTAAWGLQEPDEQRLVVWNASATSWHSPAPQVRDDLATQSAIYADPARQLREHLVATLRPSGRLTAPPDPTLDPGGAVASRRPRAPPAA